MEYKPPFIKALYRHYSAFSPNRVYNGLDVKWYIEPPKRFNIVYKGENNNVVSTARTRWIFTRPSTNV